MTRKKAPAKIEIAYRGVDTLQADPNNARQHPPEQIARLRASIKKYGFTKPVALKPDGKTIGAGNGAWEAAKAEGLKEIPTITLRLTDSEWTAYAIADNKLPMGAAWNEDILRMSLTELHGAGFDLGDMGFAALELGQLGVAGFELETRLERAEETLEPPAVPVVARGELWTLGDHRLICGDSTDKDTVDRLLAGAKPHLMVTDPPYGVNYDPSWRARAGVNLNAKKSFLVAATIIGAMSPPGTLCARAKRAVGPEIASRTRSGIYRLAMTLGMATARRSPSNVCAAPS